MDIAPTKILTTLDGSALAEAVLPYVRMLAASLRVPVELISVIDLRGVKLLYGIVAVRF